MKKSTTKKALLSAEEQSAQNLMCEMTIGYRLKLPVSQMPQISNSTDVVRYLRDIWNEDQIQYREEFYIVCVTRSQKVIGWVNVSKGGVAGTIADPKIIFQHALKSNSSGILLCHNHPSGNTKPSQQDIDLTDKLIKAGKLLDIKILDHIILTDSEYLSMAEDGIMTF